MYGFCLADPKDKTELYRDKDKTKKVLSAERIMQGVINGVNSGGNCSGIATPQGFVNFHPRFRGKPLVFVGTIGLIPKKNVQGKDLISKQAKPGDYVVMLGGRVGLDGIHGATFSSVALDSSSPATAVQIGDPITQKKMSDVLVKEARDKNLFSSITDNGAGGLSCSVAEMARESNGFEVELTKVPLKYAGLSPWQIWISESQERMTLSVSPKQWPKLKKLMDSRGVEATRIGVFTNSGKAVVKNKGKIILDLDLDFLHNGLPVKSLQTKKPSPFPKGSTSQQAGEGFQNPPSRLKSGPPSFKKGGIKPRVIVLSGYGLNCEEETAFAFNSVGGQAEIVHINDVIAKKVRLADYQIMALPGGFSYGDDTGSGKAYGNKLKNHLSADLKKFAEADKLIIGICNGFQILTNTGLLPGALLANDSARYTVRWVDVRVQNDSPWLKGISTMMLPIAHGEGKFYADKKVFAQMEKKGQIALTYYNGEISKHYNLPANPNGAMADIAGITGFNGRVLGLMPHPERAMFFTQLPHWPLLRETLRRASPAKPMPTEGPGIQVFKNAINYFKV
jgi:phosphoribosylformylglycinamidine synthase I